MLTKTINTVIHKMTFRKRNDLCIYVKAGE